MCFLTRLGEGKKYTVSEFVFRGRGDVFRRLRDKLEWPVLLSLKNVRWNGGGETLIEISSA